MPHWQLGEVYPDHTIGGATTLRPGYQMHLAGWVAGRRENITPTLALGPCGLALAVIDANGAPTHSPTRHTRDADRRQGTAYSSVGRRNETVNAGDRESLAKF